VQRYEGPGGSIDYAWDLALDSSGNCYVTGFSLGGTTGIDCTTIKYDTDGNELWVEMYNNPNDGPDFGYAIAVDIDGNVYVTGKSEGDREPDEALTIKYDTDGIFLWEARFNGPGMGPDKFFDIVLDDSANVYVTGQACIGSGLDDYDTITVRYDTDGNLIWANLFNGNDNGVDIGKALTIDTAGNIYVIGTSWDSTLDNEYCTVKYNFAGVEDWIMYYNGPGNGIDQGASIALDRYNNIFVTGRSINSKLQYDYVTIKYGKLALPVLDSLLWQLFLLGAITFFVIWKK